MKALFNPENIQVANLPADLDFDPATAAILGNAAFMLRGQHSRNLIRAYSDPEVVVDFGTPVTVPEEPTADYYICLPEEDRQQLVATSNKQFAQGIVRALDGRERSQLGRPLSNAGMAGLGLGIPGAIGGFAGAETSDPLLGIVTGGSLAVLTKLDHWVYTGVAESYRREITLNPRFGRLYQWRLDDAAKRIACLGMPNIVTAAV